MMKSDLKSKAKSIAESSDVIEWIENALRRERAIELEASNESAKRLLESRNWCVRSIGEDWEVGIRFQQRHDGFFVCSKSKSVMDSARLMLETLSGLAEELRKDLE